MSDTYPLARQGVFATWQGEGLLLGLPMVFVRLAGCDVGCDGCDTDYAVASRATAADIAARAAAVATPGTTWAWVTGGEPTLHDLRPLYAELRRAGFRIALATAGVRDVGPLGSVAGGPDFVSVSPHRLDESWVVRRGDQCNLVPGLNGLTLADIEAADRAGAFAGFSARWVTPVWYGANGKAGNVAECAAFVARRPGFRLGIQAHKTWGVA